MAGKFPEEGVVTLPNSWKQNNMHVNMLSINLHNYYITSPTYTNLSVHQTFTYIHI